MRPSFSKLRPATPQPSCSGVQHASPQPSCSGIQHVTPPLANSSPLDVSIPAESDHNEISTDKTFTQLFPTPVIKTSSRGRRKALNSTAQVVVKSLFNKSTAKQEEKKKQLPRQQQKKKQESWFCFLCQRDEQLSMRLCCSCFRYVHEDCVGLTKDDKIDFVCPQCSE